MIYTPERPISFNQIAAEQTIGGRAYGPAIADQNGYGFAGDIVITSPVKIPDEWIGPARVTVTPDRNPAAVSNQTLLLVSAGALLLALVASR